MSTPATVEIWESNTNLETPTKITGLDFGSADEPNLVAANHPLVIPVSGAVYAYNKWTRWKVVAWVDTNTIDNLMWYKSAGTIAANWSEHFKDASNPAFVTPARDKPAFPFGTPWPTSAGTARLIDGTFNNPTTGYSSYADMNVAITNLVVAGVKGQHTITYRYDES